MMFLSVFCFCFFFFFKQKTEYEVRISDWSSDVCSSDLENETLEAYDHRRVSAFSGLEQRLDDGITVGGGIQFERTHIEEPDRTLNYTLVGTPLFVRRDVTDSLLELGRASCRERVCKNVSISVVAVSLKKKNKRKP